MYVNISSVAVFALSHKQDKPSFLIVDPYGEIYENLYEVLKNNGYILYDLVQSSQEKIATFLY